MSLPDNFQDEVRQTCDAQGVHYENVMRDLGRLLGEDTILDWTVWGGPGWSQEAVVLDVYALSRYLLYNYSVYNSESEPITSAASAMLLASIGDVALVSVKDQRSPYVLVLRAAGEIGRIFANEAYLPRLDRFMHAILSAIIETKGRLQ